MRKNYYLYLVTIGLLFSGGVSNALEFEPGVGLGMQYTDNAELAPNNKTTDVITTGFVGANIAENEGPLVYGAAASLRRENYNNDIFEDKSYFGLSANVNWEMMRERFNWFLTDDFTQGPVDTLDSDIPDNRQDSNAFVFGANINFPISGLQSISLVPQFNQNYYEVSTTDNQQFSLTTQWNYQVFRLTSIGLNLSARQIDYVDSSITNTSFIDFGFMVSGQRVSSSYAINLGWTNVSRDEDEEERASVGSITWQSELSSRSTIEAVVLSEITDTSSVSQNSSPGNPNDVQLSTDVIRNSIIGLTYSREDAALHTSILGEYRKIKYSDNTSLNTLVQTFGAKLGFPVAQLVSSGVFLNFSNSKRQEIFREDKRFNVGANVDVTFTQKLSGSLIVQYRTKESTDSLQNYDEFSVFVGLNYGFGGVKQRSVAY